MVAAAYMAKFLASIPDRDLDECWLWLGSTRGAGYGQCSEFVEPSRIAPRAAYKLANGPIEPGYWVLHTCDVPLCVNPSHLVLGRPKDNTADMMAKGRFGYHSGKDRAYNTTKAREALARLYASQDYRTRQGGRIAQGHALNKALNQANIRQFAFNFPTPTRSLPL